MSLAGWIDRLPDDTAREALLRCCGSHRWAEEMLHARPFRSDDRIFESADRVWFALGETDRREAFAAHPRIGGRAEGWSEGEQAGLDHASEGTRAALLAGNHRYEERFGHVFLICATGLSAETLLAALRARIDNEPEEELRIATAEQAKITHLRLEKLAQERGTGKG